MGTWATEIDRALRDGHWVITASDRAARSLVAAFHRARRAEGLTAWPAPRILDWKSFVRAEWLARSSDGRLLLNPAQEQTLWAEIAGNSNHLATLLEGPRHRLARLAMEAHELLCSHAPRFLQEEGRSTWQQDAAAFSGWLSTFEQACQIQNLLSPSRIPSKLVGLLRDETSDPRAAARSPLILVGFDRLQPVQRAVFSAWGAWQEATSDDLASELHFHAAPDTQAELTACALWCNQKLVEDPQARLLVITQDASARRGQIERAFLAYTGNRFEFSLGIPLSQVAFAKAAFLLLRWFAGSLAEQEVDWLLSTGFAAATAEESLALQSLMRALRQRGLERTHWSLKAFLSQPLAARALPSAWMQRLIEAQRQLESLSNRPQSPLDWAELVPKLLKSAGWPGGRPLASAEFQANQRWQQALEATGSLGFDARRMRWTDFLSALARTLDETLFASESREVSIQIAGPAESAGLSADAVWFLGASEGDWPSSGPLHPLLPVEVQRETGMPHATAQHDGELAHTITLRLLGSSQEVRFSYARQTETAEARPSRLIVQIAGPPQTLPPALCAPTPALPLTETFADTSHVPFPRGKAEGGSSVLTSQSQCPFKAFASARLGAQGWQLAQEGLTAAQRGQLLHAVLHAVWAGPPHGIRTHAELIRLGDLRSFVEDHVRRVLEEEIRPEVRERMAHRYLELEAIRLARLVTEWLNYEATRIDFSVAETEVSRSITLAGLTLNLRLDRVDRLVDESLLVIDYKTGNVAPSAWELPRPDDVQLPLYASFGVDGELGGLVFAKVRAGEQNFVGRVGDAKATLFENLTGNGGLVKYPLTAEQLIDWREAIEQLAQDFVAGKAEVDPRDPPQTCQYCGLETLCRIQEKVASDEEDSVEENDE